jgi:hypothetical protein
MLKAREALLRQRQDIDRSIAELDRLIAKLGPAGGTKERRPRAQAGTMRAAILEDLTANPIPWSVSAILGCLHERPEFVNTSDASLRSVLNKMRERNEITNPSRGHYQIAASEEGAGSGSETDGDSNPPIHAVS